MLFYSISFLLGDVFLQFQPMLPGRLLLLPIIVMVVIIYALNITPNKVVIIICWFALGYVWSAWQAVMITSIDLFEYMDKTVTVIGTVYSMPKKTRYATQFLFSIKSIHSDHALTPVNALIMVSWPGDRELKVGDKYQFSVHVKKIHGLSNPGGQDYERWAYVNRIQAKATVTRHSNAVFLGESHNFPLSRLRQWLLTLLYAHLPATNTSAWLPALILGDRSLVNPKDWRVLQATGTNHLMAIAGLHIGLVAGMVASIFSWGWRLSSQLMLRVPAQIAGCVAALTSAWVYGALSGLSIPTQRACIMFTCFIFVTLLRLNITTWRILLFSLLIIIVVDPNAVLSVSFLLSFTAMGLLIYGLSGRLQPTGIWWKYFHAQWVMAVGFAPMTLALFQQISLMSMFVNAIAIPVIGLAVLPTSLLGQILLLISPALGSLTLTIADFIFSYLWAVMSWIAQLKLAVWYHDISTYTSFGWLFLACLICILPAGTPGRWFAVVAALPFITQSVNRPSTHEFWLTVLDVGQGLSVIVETKGHLLVYDTGLKFNQYDMGEKVVLPYLRNSNRSQVDVLMVSHADNDHAGGVDAIFKQLPIHSFLTSDPGKFSNHPAKACQSGQTWQWDGVSFEVLYPFNARLATTNNQSCVLAITNGSHRVLLTGDIEKQAEKELLAITPDKLRATMMTAPHHGSKTSSHQAFISAIHPLYVVYSTGYRNRYRMPHQSVLRRYQHEGVFAINTMRSGAVQFKFSQRNKEIMPIQYRYQNKHYWSFS